MRLLVCHRDAGSQRYFARLAPLLAEFEIVESPPGVPPGPLENVDALLAAGPVGRAEMERGTFRFIQTVTSGYDHIDLAAATGRGIRVANVPAGESGNAESVAELAILLILALSRRLAQAERAVREGLLAQPLGQALLGKTACIIGLGAVGLALASRLHAFGMTITATRRDATKPAPGFVQVFAVDRIDAAVAGADYVIVCARAAEDNAGLIGAPELASMKKGAILINVARGSLVDPAALLAALQSGHLRGAGLDVFWQEPVDVSHPLLQLEQVLATPHIGGVTDVNLSRTMEIVARNLKRFAAGETPNYLVNGKAQ
jgi:phosphoglycerate dehydrogenase-like enzyme